MNRQRATQVTSDRTKQRKAIERSASGQFVEMAGTNLSPTFQAVLPQSLGNRALQHLVLRQSTQPNVAQPAAGRITVQMPIQETYTIAGRTLAELMSQLDPDEWGHCQCDYILRYVSKEGQITKVDITLKITIRLPRWIGGKKQASAAAIAEWNRMLTVLKRHEDRHAEIGRSWVQILQNRLVGIDASDFAMISEQLKAEAQQAQDVYDASSLHGQNEGVNLDTSID